jgi:hypothetical protein
MAQPGSRGAAEYGLVACAGARNTTIEEIFIFNFSLSNMKISPHIKQTQSNILDIVYI